MLSRDEWSARFDKWMRLRRISRCRRERARWRGKGPRPCQRGRLATEAAGAEDVVDRSPSSETNAASHRPTHDQGSLADQNANRSVAIPPIEAPGGWTRDPTLQLRPVRNRTVVLLPQDAGRRKTNDPNGSPLRLRFQSCDQIRLRRTCPSGP